MTLGRQWQTLRSSLPDGWGDVRLLLAVDDAARAERATALLAPLTSGRHGSEVRFGASRASGPGENGIRRLLARLDAEGITGTLELVAVVPTERQPAPARTDAVPAGALTQPTADGPWRGEPVAPQWEAALSDLPPDWTDILAEVEIDSSDLLERTALLMGPLNPARDRGRFAFRFRCARTYGYGASPGMVRRCLERIDGEGIPATFRLLRALSDTRPVYTQGPVWYVGGKAV